MKSWTKIAIWSVLWITIIGSICTKYSWIAIVCALPFGIISMVNVEF